MSSKIQPLCGRLMLVLMAAVSSLGGCSSDPKAPAAPITCEPGETLLEDGRCQPAGLPLDMQCQPGELALENGGCQPAGLPLDMVCPPGEYEKEGGGCEPAGIPPEMCAPGFMPDGDRGCEPILPADPCPDGLMAIPGDTVCREVMPCGVGDYGDIPVDATTQYVNAAYAGNDSNGTKTKPWKTIQAGINAAASGAIVAVAAGTYNENLVISGKPVALWGRCPAMVDVKGAGAVSQTVQVYGTKATGTEVHGVSVAGSKQGISVSGAQGIIVDRARVHDTGNIGINVENLNDIAEVTLTNCLLERATMLALASAGASVSIEGSVIRDTQPQSNGLLGRGIHMESFGNVRARVSARDSLLERNRDCGVWLLGSDFSAESTVIRDTQVDGAQRYGLGIFAVAAGPDQKSAVTLVGSVVERNQDTGVFLWGAMGDIRATVISKTQIGKGGAHGAAIEALFDGFSEERSSVELMNVLIDENDSTGIEVVSSDAAIEATVVRGTKRIGIGDAGIGIIGGDDQKAKQRSNVVIRRSTSILNESTGIDFTGSDVTIEGTVVRDNHHGIEIEKNKDTGEVGKLVLRESVIEQNADVGLLALGGEADVESCVVRSTYGLAPYLGGSGIEVQSIDETRGRIDLRGVLVEKNQGVGVIAFNSDAFVDGCVVIDTLVDAEGISRGMNVQSFPTNPAPGYAEISRSLVARNGTIGIYVSSSKVIIDSTEVREHRSTSADVDSIGVVFEPGSTVTMRTHGVIKTSVIEANQGGGIFNVASDVEILGTIVRNSELAVDGIWGRGIQVQADDKGARGNLELHGSLLENNREVGIFFSSSDGEIESTVIRATLSNDSGAFGDGVGAASSLEQVMKFGSAPPSVTIHDTRIENNARAGVANFGANIVLTNSELVCHAFDLNGESAAGYAWSFDGSRDNQCGCPEAAGACGAKSAGIGAPKPTLESPGPVSPM